MTFLSDRGFPRRFHRWLFPVLLVACNLSAYSQVRLTGLSASWSDSFHEWVVYCEEAEQEIEGTLLARWHLSGNFSEWDYRLGERTGQIRRKWKDDPNEWELRSDNEIVMARTIWSNDFREWRIKYRDLTIVWKTRYGNNLEEWQLRDDRRGEFVVYTSWEGDPRQWEIVDELDPEIPPQVKMMLTFLTLYHSLPW